MLYSVRREGKTATQSAPSVSIHDAIQSLDQLPSSSDALRVCGDSHGSCVYNATGMS
jgi:hypothetical protein